MNILLQINKKFLLLTLVLITFLFLIIYIVNSDQETTNSIVENKNDPSFDIINPSFTINNEKDKISVKAEEGNFLGNDLILLEKNVIFKSSNFKLTSEKVIFNQKNEEAKSDQSSKFISEGTIIRSEGFKIAENGNIILFNGKTKLILEK